MMSNLEQEKILLSIVQDEENEDSLLDEGLGARHLINKPNSTQRQPGVTLIHTNTVPSHQEQSYKKIRLGFFGHVPARKRRRQTVNNRV